MATTESAAPKTTKGYISVMVYKGEPLDYQQYRHVAIWIRFGDGSESALVNIVGPNKDYKTEVSYGNNPADGRSFLKEVQVGWTTTPMPAASLVTFIWQTPIDNSTTDFDCQKWVALALQRLAQSRYLGEAECRNGVNAMVDATLEGAEEERGTN